jgi:hypothetical protein
MQAKVKHLLLPLGLIVAAAIACNFSTASLKDMKIAKDQDGKNEISKVGPSDKFYAVSQVSSNPGKVKVKFRILYDDVKGKKAGDLVTNFGTGETTLDVDGSRPVYLELTMPPAGMPNGKYKIEAKMINEAGEEKDSKSATFNVEGFPDE